jgi:hypothetical protein
MATFIDLVCSECETPFKKALGEYNRRLKLNPNPKFFCNHTCAAGASNRERHPSSYRPRTEHLVASNRRDALTPFRWFVARAYYRRHKKGCGITAAFLSQLWEAQGGACPVTGWALRLPSNTAGWPEGRDPRNASLDRIDPTRGYVEGNVRFVACIFNYARNTFTDDDVRKFCEAVVHNKSR